MALRVSVRGGTPVPASNAALDAVMSKVSNAQMPGGIGVPPGQMPAPSWSGSDVVQFFGGAVPGISRSSGVRGPAGSVAAPGFGPPGKDCFIPTTEAAMKRMCHPGDVAARGATGLFGIMKTPSPGVQAGDPNQNLSLVSVKEEPATDDENQQTVRPRKISTNPRARVRLSASEAVPVPRGKKRNFGGSTITEEEQDHAEEETGAEDVVICTPCRVEPCPDGRTCNLCPAKDSDMDPVVGHLRYRWRQKPDRASGRTVGNVCYYCQVNFRAKYASKAQAQTISMEALKASAGQDAALHKELQDFKAKVVNVKANEWALYLEDMARHGEDAAEVRARIQNWDDVTVALEVFSGKRVRFETFARNNAKLVKDSGFNHSLRKKRRLLGCERLRQGIRRPPP